VAVHVADGISRVRLEGNAPTEIRIELAPVARRLLAGERLRLEISSSRFPRFDRHPNTAVAPARAHDGDGTPARQRVHHDAEHPSCLRFGVIVRDGSGP
jgi:predicted acyl esterase